MKFVTTPIYYVNDTPHIGHAVTTLAADVWARYWRLRHNSVFMLTGTDEHGAKIAEAADKNGQEPLDFVTGISTQFRQTWNAINIAYDGFIRTTDPSHEAYVQRFLQRLYDAGHIYKGEYRGWYCVGCEEFKTESDIGPDNTCLIHLKPLVEVAEESYLFKLSQYQDKLLHLLETDELVIRPIERKNEVISFIKQGLRDVAISRKSVPWGIPVPWDTTHTIYVWIDALLNYLSAAEADGLTFENGKRPEFPPTLQLIGKDILRFHAIIWPAMLLAADKPLPRELFVHGYFTIAGQKMSKSLGNAIRPAEMIERYGVDGTRYLLLAIVPFGADGDLSMERFDAVCTSELANSIGNHVNRVQSMLQRYRNGVVPVGEITVWGTVVSHYARAIEQELNYAHALRIVIDYLGEWAAYIQKNEPWTLAKSEQAEDQARLDKVLATLAETVYALGVLLAPFMPDTSAKILSLFGTSVEQVDYGTLGTSNHTGGITIQPIEPLFPRLPEE